MSMPSFEELEAQGFRGDALYHESFRIFQTLPPQERIEIYAEAMRKNDVRSKEFSFAFEVAAECLSKKPYAYDAIATLHDRREEVEESYNKVRAWYENEIMSFEREISSSGSNETEGKAPTGTQGSVTDKL